MVVQVLVVQVRVQVRVQVPGWERAMCLMLHDRRCCQSWTWALVVGRMAGVPLGCLARLAHRRQQQRVNGTLVPVLHSLP